VNIRRILSPLTTYGLFVAMCGTLALASTTETSAYALRRCTGVEVVAHRGTATAARTENTMRSFQGAVSLGARTLETDLQLTSDGQWVLMHDASVTRTTNGKDGRSVASLTLAEIKALRTNDGVVGGVPAAQDLINYAKAHPAIKLQLEVKSTAASPAQLQQLLTMISTAGIKSRVMIISFSKTPLLRVKAIDPTWNRGLITGAHYSPATIKSLGNNLILNQNAASVKYLRQMRNAGVRVYTWTVNTKGNWRKVVRNGAAGVTTDRVNLMRNYCASARR
jgi:glycerophosphoryl diester phosphodiesterase